MITEHPLRKADHITLGTMKSKFIDFKRVMLQQAQRVRRVEQPSDTRQDTEF